MQNINKIQPFKSNIKKTELGILTILETEIQISTHGSIEHGNSSLLSNYIYVKNGTYNLVYTIIDPAGNEESFQENDGILPDLFLSPEQENYVSIIPYDPDKELEISVPVFNRENIKLTKGNRPFVGDFIGISNQYSIFYHTDIWSESKPDKILAIEFKEKVIKKKHTIKVPLPKYNQIFICNNEIHLLTSQNSFWLHRQIDEKGSVLKERKLKSGFKNFSEILNLSFEESSYIISQKNGEIFSLEINKEGECKHKSILDFKDDFYSTWGPERIKKDTYVIRFTAEFGNGWFTVQKDNILEFFYNKGVNGYKNLITNEIFEMPIDNLVISSLNKTKENNYLLVFYPKTDEQIKNNKLVILNREAKF